MDNFAIKVENVVVRYNKASEKIDNLKEYFIKLIQRRLRFEEFWALNDISFKINKGDAWGLIGKNGSGKSTLLKAICGILRPYSGKITIHGEISPLIELGIGFNNQLTAEENIFLHGAVLGYSKKFMKDRFSGIVEFAELQEFMEIPLKNFSTGMRARLGFAIATLVNPDILVVDEVLSVGDKSFQKKCETRMSEMLENGTTLLLVSHSETTILKMCQQSIWLNKGICMKIGESQEVIDAYNDFLEMI